MSKLFSKNVSSWGVASNINRCKTMGSIANGQRVIMLLLELYDVYPALKNLSIKQRYSEISSALGINERTIRRTCEMLCDHGFLHKENNIKTSDKDKTKKDKSAIYLGFLTDLRAFDNKLGLGFGLGYYTPKKGLFLLNATTNNYSFVCWKFL